ncbi:MAG: 50S ribosomal protein L19 [Planctomycetes bacterium]|nr:50S ribosomal protein L19 [Planctomycetota bacterium]
MTGFAYDLECQEITKTNIPVFHIGDTLSVYVRIKEGEKERQQLFTGVCIARKNGGLRETFTVRRIVDGEGVERVFPLHSPNVVKIEVTRAGKVRRAKLYYLRDRVGKATRIAERVKAKHLGELDEKRNFSEKAKEEAPAEEPKEEPKAEAPKEEVKAEAPAEKPAEAETKEESKEESSDE